MWDVNQTLSDYYKLYLNNNNLIPINISLQVTLIHDEINNKQISCRSSDPLAWRPLSGVNDYFIYAFRIDINTIKTYN